MKKFLILAASAALVLGACSKNEIVTSGNLVPVTFGTYIGNVKATSETTYGDLTLSALQGSSYGFGVFGYYADNSGNGNTNDIASAANPAKFTPNFMYNQKVTYSASKWSYSPLKYWPNEYSAANAKTDAGIDKLSFTAYAPHVTTVGDDGITAFSTNTATGSPTIAFKVPADGAKQIDLLYAKNFASTINLVKSTIPYAVSFEFAHALSQLSFKVQAVVDEVTPSTGALDAATTITLNSITLKAGSINESGTLTLTDGSWSSTSASASDHVYSDIDQNVTTTLTAVEKGGSAISLYAVPGAIAAGNLQIEVVYTVVTTDAALPGGKVTMVNDIYNVSTAAFTFEANKKNVVNLLLGMTSLKMTVTSIDAWGDGDETTVNLPVNVAGA